jgi:CspA family cold shock protein
MSKRCFCRTSAVQIPGRGRDLLPRKWSRKSRISSAQRSLCGYLTGLTKEFIRSGNLTISAGNNNQYQDKNQKVVEGSIMSTGQVKWFNNAKGFGFILPDGGGGDLFAHYSAITMDGYKTLKAGQNVSFDIVEGPKGLHAANIQAVNGEERMAQPSMGNVR